MASDRVVSAFIGRRRSRAVLYARLSHEIGMHKALGRRALALDRGCRASWLSPPTDGNARTDAPDIRPESSARPLARRFEREM